MKQTNRGETIMNVTYYLKITKRCAVTGLLLVGVKADEEGQVMILDDSFDAKIAQASAEDDLRNRGDFDSVVTKVRLADEYAVPS